jgi:hypothetical protein
VLYSLQYHLRTGTNDLHHPILASAEHTDSWCAKKGNLQHVFPLDILMVPSSMITIATNDEHLMCGGFSLGETIHLGSLSSSLTTSVA